MSNHVPELLRLRDTDELKYRQQILRLLGAAPEPDLGPPDRKTRRVEGTITIPGRDGGTIHGLVMNAIGDEGHGALSDVRSKNAQPSARSLLVARGADFIVLVTAGSPPASVVEMAEDKSDLFFLGAALHRRIWVMGVPEVVARAELFLATREDALLRSRSLWTRISRFLFHDEQEELVSPLQVELDPFTPPTE